MAPTILSSGYMDDFSYVGPPEKRSYTYEYDDESVGSDDSTLATAHDSSLPKVRFHDHRSQYRHRPSPPTRSEHRHSTSHYSGHRRHDSHYEELRSRAARTSNNRAIDSKSAWNFPKTPVAMAKKDGGKLGPKVEPFTDQNGFAALALTLTEGARYLAEGRPTAPTKAKNNKATADARPKALNPWDFPKLGATLNHGEPAPAPKKTARPAPVRPKKAPPPPSRIDSAMDDFHLIASKVSSFEPRRHSPEPEKRPASKVEISVRELPEPEIVEIFEPQKKLTKKEKKALAKAEKKKAREEVAAAESSDRKATSHLPPVPRKHAESLTPTQKIRSWCMDPQSKPASERSDAWDGAIDDSGLKERSKKSGKERSKSRHNSHGKEAGSAASWGLSLGGDDPFVLKTASNRSQESNKDENDWAREDASKASSSRHSKPHHSQKSGGAEELDEWAVAGAVASPGEKEGSRRSSHKSSKSKEAENEWGAPMAEEDKKSGSKRSRSHRSHKSQDAQDDWGAPVADEDKKSDSKRSRSHRSHKSKDAVEDEWLGVEADLLEDEKEGSHRSSHKSHGSRHTHRSQASQNDAPGADERGAAVGDGLPNWLGLQQQRSHDGSKRSGSKQYSGSGLVPIPEDFEVPASPSHGSMPGAWQDNLQRTSSASKHSSSRSRKSAAAPPGSPAKSFASYRAPAVEDVGEDFTPEKERKSEGRRSTHKSRSTEWEYANLGAERPASYRRPGHHRHSRTSSDKTGQESRPDRQRHARTSSEKSSKKSSKESGHKASERAISRAASMEKIDEWLQSVPASPSKESDGKDSRRSKKSVERSAERNFSWEDGNIPEDGSLGSGYGRRASSRGSKRSKREEKADAWEVNSTSSSVQADVGAKQTSIKSGGTRTSSGRGSKASRGASLKDLGGSTGGGDGWPQSVKSGGTGRSKTSHKSWAGGSGGIAAPGSPLGGW